MGPAPADQTGSDHLLWTDPLVVDVISAGYTRLVQDHAKLAALVRCHVLLWRCLLSGRGEAATFQRELLRLADRSQVAEAKLDALNQQVIIELLDTIAARYTRSPREAGRLSFEVTRAACRLAQAFPRVPA